MGQRSRAREHALQMLFQIDLTGVSPQDVFRDFWNDHTVPSEIRGFAEELVLGVQGDRRELDRWIIGSAENWRIERMAVVDRNVLRMAVHEIVHDPDTPDAVIIDEAIEVAKKYGSEESGSFINGVLDAIRKRKERGEVGPGPADHDG